MKKITIIGHFAYKENKNDGQTVKTREIMKQLQKENISVETVDTQNWKKRKFDFFKEVVSKSKESEKVVLIVASGGVKILIPILAIIKKIYKVEICYIAIGSWFDKRVKKNIILKNAAKKMDLILVETEELLVNLKKLKFDNVKKMYNFKEIKNVVKKDITEKNKFCIFSRIMEEKGITDAILAIAQIRNELKENIFLDIYGPVSDNYKKKFDKLLEENGSFVKYCGNVPPIDSCKIISQYYMLLFPTRFIKEGLPGTLIDAYYSGTPVIAANWLSANEFVPSSVGYVYSFCNNEELKKTIQYCLKNPEEVESKREKCEKFVKIFDPKIAIKPLLEFLSE